MPGDIGKARGLEDRPDRYRRNAPRKGASSATRPLRARPPPRKGAAPSGDSTTLTLRNLVSQIFEPLGFSQRFVGCFAGDQPRASIESEVQETPFDGHQQPALKLYDVQQVYK